MLKTFSAGGIVLNRKGQVLIVSQPNGCWSLPKGHIDPGEDELTAAKREIYEESGLRSLRLVKPLGRYERPKIGRGGGDDVSEIKTITLFLFTTDEEKLAPVDPDNEEARWVEPEEVPNHLTHPKDRESTRPP